jgi:hypothetical protein
MHYDQKSLVLRTVRLGKRGSVDGVYHYMAQRGIDFNEWLKLKPMSRLRMVRYRDRTDRAGFYRIGGASVYAARRKHNANKKRKKK